MKHVGCGGEVREDPTLEPYEYDANEDGHPTKIPAYSCAKCGKEILGDTQIELEGVE